MIEIVELEEQPAAVVRATLPFAELGGFFSRAFEAVLATLATQGVAPAGPPFAYYPGMVGDTVEVAAGFPTELPVDPSGEVVALTLPGGRAALTTHVGPYETMGATTYPELPAWMAAEGLEPASGSWEVYLTGPTNEPDPATWRTRIVWPVR